MCKSGGCVAPTSADLHSEIWKVVSTGPRGYGGRSGRFGVFYFFYICFYFLSGLHELPSVACLLAIFK
jgi:hypothetical protein